MLGGSQVTIDVWACSDGVFVQDWPSSTPPAPPNAMIAWAPAALARAIRGLTVELSMPSVSPQIGVHPAPTAGALRDYWLATEERASPARVAATAETTDESLEAVASGLGVVLLSAGNAAIYQRDDIVCRPVTGLSASQLAVVWRTGDERAAVRVFVDASCLCSAVANELVTPASVPAKG